MADSQAGEFLKGALFYAAVASFAAILPIWPYGYYILLRWVVTGVSVYALVTIPTLGSGQRAALAGITLIFNPLIPVHLSRGIWTIFNLGVGGYFLLLRGKMTVVVAEPDPSELQK